MPKPIRQIDQFAEVMANSAWQPHDGNVRVCAQRLGLPASRGNALMQVLRREMGDQAR